jgi:elongation factor Ts
MSLELIKQIRMETDLPFGDIKKAIDQVGEDKNQVITYLREQGSLKSSKRSDRTTEQGLIFTYVHEGRMGVILELLCETDFVSRTDDFKDLGKNLCLQVVGSQPKFIDSSEVNQEMIDEEMRIQRTVLESEGKSSDIIDMIITGKRDKYLEEIVLLEQPFIKDTSIKIKDILNRTSQKTGEKIQVSRFHFYILGKS